MSSPSPKKLRRSQVWGAAVLLAGGLAMAIGGLWVGRDSAQFLEAATRAQGVVLALIEKRGVKGPAMDHAIVRFSPTETGPDIVFASKAGLWPSPFAVGDIVTVAYPPGDPEAAEIESFWTLWLLPVVMVAFGLLCSWIGWYGLRQKTLH